jgi:hypothetical protein
MTNPDTIEGGCLCGAVRFAIQTPTKWCAHCHCSMCRRAHGAALVTWVGVDASQFQLLSGEKELRKYPSSPAAVRSFCSVCGSPLFFESKRWAGEVHVARAAIPGEVDRDATAHVFYSDRADWFVVTDDVPRKGGPTGTEPL